MKYEEVEKYLRGYSTDVPPYDANGALHLFKSILENMKENFIDADFEEYAKVLDDGEEAFLKKLLDAIQSKRSGLEKNN